jgi:ferredoxin-type protein NapG
MGKAKDDNQIGVSRRELLTFWRRPLAELKEPPPVGLGEPATAAPVERRAPLRPPGMMREALLLDLCERCGKCVAACPAEAIFPLGPEWGRAAGTPAIEPRLQPCVLCTGLVCTHACPTGALQPVERNEDVKMGRAVLDERTCLAHHGQPCDACLAACPVPGAIAVAADGRVRVGATCVGCGLCVRACPTEPTSITVLPRA